MPALLDFTPVFQESAATIRARMDADANAGLSVGDPRWLDTREGTFYWDITQVVVLELARLWDALSLEVVAAAFPIFAWGDYLDYHAALFGLERKAAVAAEGVVKFTGTQGSVIATGAIVSALPASPDGIAVEFATTATATIPVAGWVEVGVVAVDPGSEGNVSSGAITSIDSPLVGVDTVTNDAATEGGTDVEDDEALRERLMIEFEGQGGGSINDYKRWALSRPGVGRVFVNPVWNGPGTVQVVLMTATGDPVSGAVVADVQTYLDPTAGTADGVAPPGITVTVQTPAAVAINVAATVTFKPGYSLDGTGGTVEQRSLILKALSDYIDSLQVGETVVYQHVLAQFFRADGVYSVGGLTVNGGTADVALTSNPPQVASLGTVTLT